MDKIKVVVASKNPTKIKCSLDAFQKSFPMQEIIIEPLAVLSGVADQPMSDAETLEGARNRANHAKLAQSDADFWVGLEGGIADDGEQMEAFAWICTLSQEREGKARSASFDLPPQIRDLVLSGIELGHADDMVFERKNSKHGNGAVGILTHGLIDRAAYYEQAVILALIPFINAELYNK